MEPYTLCILCRDPQLFCTLSAAAAADGIPVVTDAGQPFDALLLDAFSLAVIPVPRLHALRSAGVRVFMILDGYDAPVAANVRQAADYLFCLPLLPKAVLRRIRLFVQGAAAYTPPPTLDAAWIERQTDACLKAVGMPPHLLGYRYMRAAVRHLVRSETPMHLSMMRDIYPAVAKEAGTGPVMVDRAMKHAVEVAWRKGNVLLQQVYFGYSSVDKKGMPTNAECLYAIADRVRMLLCDPRGKDRFASALRMLERASECGLSVDVTDGAW